jgi:transcription initiation factor TFIIE subunit alpha
VTGGDRRRSTPCPFPRETGENRRARGDASKDLMSGPNKVPVMAFEDLLEDPVIQKYLHELVGPKGMPVAAAPPDGEVTDEELAEELDLELNDVRRALFILYENDLATYRRLRDEDSGWLTYLWTFQYDNIPENLEEEMHRLLEALQNRREYERDHEFYLCEVDSIRFEFGEAMEFGFECPECGSPLEAMENTRLVDSMDERIDALRDELNVEA